uniref:uncharacterized protein LOC128929206 n=1 Tax=Callithrix jacchus TaxID=9483 RepID=UPI0023DD1A0F|nr:uncharacterized protein LOC128929206 [Callithrix jacchus]
MDTYSGYGFAYPVGNASAKTTICGLMECLIHHHGISHSIASDQGTHFMAKEVWQWAHAHGIHLSYHIAHCPDAAGLLERWNGLLNSQLQCEPGDNTLQGWGKVIQKAMFALNQRPIYGTVSSIAKIQGSTNQGVKVEVTPLIIIPSDLAKILLPVLVTLCSVGLEVLVLEGETLLPENATMIPLNWMLRLPPGHFWLLLSLSQQAQKGVTVLTGVIDPDYQDEISLLLCNGGKEEYKGNIGDPLGCLLVLPCPVIKVNGKLQQPNPGRTTNGPDRSGLKVWVTPAGKKTRPAETLAEGKG